MQRRRLTPGSPPPPETLLGGIVRLVFFNPSGFAGIGNSPQAFLSSLAPLLAFVLVGGLVEVAAWGWRMGLGDGLQTLCVVLGQPVVSHFYARLLKREDRWLRYATAMNWCQVAIPVLGLGFLAGAVLFSAAVPSPQSLAAAAIGAIFVYAVLLNWFLAWRGLHLGPWRAIGFLLCVTLTLAALLAIPVGLRLAATLGHVASITA